MTVFPSFKWISSKTPNWFSTHSWISTVVLFKSIVRVGSWVPAMGMRHLLVPTLARFSWLSFGLKTSIALSLFSPETLCISCFNFITIFPSLLWITCKAPYSFSSSVRISTEVKFKSPLWHTFWSGYMLMRELGRPFLACQTTSCLVLRTSISNIKVKSWYSLKTV